MDTGYLGIAKFYTNSVVSVRRSKKKSLTKDDRVFDHRVFSVWVLSEYVIGLIKRFKFVFDRYRNRRKRFGLRTCIQ